MDHLEEFQFKQQLEQYMMKSNINKILESLLEEIMINKPKNPIDYMINYLKVPQREFNFIIGPPGLRKLPFFQQAIQQMANQQFQVFNCGQFILKISNQLSSGSEIEIKDGLLINKQQINEKILAKIKELFQKSKQSVIVQGYPKTLQQAVNMQQAQIPITKVIFINANDAFLRQICQNKITSIFGELTEQQMENQVSLMMMEHMINIKQLKKFYNSISEIDLSSNNSQQSIKRELKRVFEIKTIGYTPRTSSHVLIIGAPHSGRTTLAKRFAQQYNLVYVSSTALISDQIRKESITGKKIKDAFLKHQLIDQFTIQKLIEERINQTDCLMQGFVLEGYPKTKEQYQNLKSLNIRPTLTVVIDLNEQDSVKRGIQNNEHQHKRFEKYIGFREFLKASKDKMFWVDSSLKEQNMFEEVRYEFEKKN